MKIKAKSAMLLGGVIAGFAAMIPMVTYAETKTADTSVTVNIATSLTVEATGVTQNINAGSISEDGRIIAAVKSNSPYTISLNAKEHADLKDPDNSYESIPASATVVAGTDAWGIKKKGGANNNDNTSNEAGYTAITTSPVVFYRAAAGTGAESIVTDFTVGISITSSLSAGTYSTDVTVTAANI